jgi:hypothetical protein
MSENDTRDSGIETTTDVSIENEQSSNESGSDDTRVGEYRDRAADETATGPDALGADSTATESDGPRADQAEPADRTPDQLEARLAMLREEHDRLRREYVRARQSRYRRTALWLGVLGAVAVVAGTFFPDQSTILLALGGTGLFSAVLTYYLTPEQFVPATVGQRIHQATTANQADLIDDLGLQDDRVYVPTPDALTPARLFVPQRSEYEIPALEDLEQLLVVTDEPATRGVAFRPAGGPLYEEFEATVTGRPATEPDRLATQLADAVVEAFELADSATVDTDREGAVVAIRVTEPVYGALDDPDHPIVSVLATGLAAGLEQPVSVRVRDVDEAGGLVVCELSE